MNSLPAYFLFAMFIGAILLDLDRAGKRAIERIDLIKDGVKFDGYIIGVARSKQIIDAEELDDDAFSGSKKENITGSYSRGSAEEAGDSRVKISFLHPDTGLHTVTRTILRKRDCRDSRIYRISHPYLIRFNNIGFIIWNHDRKLFSAYKEEVNSRNISDEDKKILLREAKQAKKAHYDKYYALLPEDGERYNYIIPSVKVQGYYLDGNFLFIQRTNKPVLEDWTKDLT
jgi:hypothetical protein